MTWTLGVATLGGSTSGAGATTLDVVVEIALTSGYTTPAASRVWTDVTDYVEAQRGLSIQWGRGDQFSSPQPSRLTVTLDNRDGRFTPENVAGAYFPNIKKGRPIRVRVRPAGGSYVHRFLGYVDEWPVEWPGGSDAMSTVTVTALSRQARLGRSTTFKSIVEEEILYDGPVLYFPLGEPQGATAAGNIAPGRSAILTVEQGAGAGGSVEFGAGTGPGTDDLTAPVFTAVDTSNYMDLFAELATPVSIPDGTTLDYECFINTTWSLDGTPITFGMGPVVANLYMNTTGNVVASVGILGGGSCSATSTVTVDDGATHHIAGRVARSGGTVTASVVVDGGTRVTGTSTTDSSTWSLRKIWVGANFSATLAHAAIYVGTALADSRIAAHATAGLTGFTTDASGARIQRYARYAGIPAAEVSVEVGVSTSIAHKDTTGALPSALMQAVAGTEDGVVFDGKDGTLTFHARSHRYGAASAFTLDANLGDVEDGFAPKLDDQHLTNDMTASRPNGITVRSTNDASITEYGYYRETLEILTTSDNEVQSRADWEVNRFGTPRVAIPNVRTDLLTSSVSSALLAADVGTKFRLTNLPSQAPATTADFFVEGGTEQIGVNSYFIEFNVSAAAYANVWQLDSGTLSQLDSTTVLAY